MTRPRTFRQMKPFTGYCVIQPEDLSWRPSNLMKIPNADFLERTQSENLSARLWRLPPQSAGTLHRHPRMEEFYFLLEGVGRIRIAEQTMTIQKHGGVLVAPDVLRQVFNDSHQDALWLVVGGPEEHIDPTNPADRALLYPRDPKELPKELAGVSWPPAS
jgi:mannose-6-phosphate isomerase-like protein (cupin superfamily)